jgi:hypothetical protein
MTPITELEPVEFPRGLVAESSAPLPVIQFPDGHTEPAPASSVHAENIIGQLTSEQIKELAAAKISGQLTPAQIEAINAGQIIGEIVNAQIKNIGANKILGFIEGSQIAAETITGANIKALTITSGLIAAESILTSKLAAGAVTTAILAANAVIAEKISAGAITTTKIAASAVTAEKLSVVTLSAITANLGTVTAGKITGVEIETLNKFSLQEKENLPPSGINKVQWQGTSQVNEEIYGTYLPVNFSHNLTLRATSNKGSRTANIQIESFDEAAPEASAAGVFASGGSGTVTIIKDGQRSTFLQILGETVKRTINFGTTTLTWTASKTPATKEIEHGLGVVPKIVIPVINLTGNASAFVNGGNYTTTKFTLGGFAPEAITFTATIAWIAIG